jgi:hypothetical protein
MVTASRVEKEAPGLYPAVPNAENGIVLDTVTVWERQLSWTGVWCATSLFNFMDTKSFTRSTVLYVMKLVLCLSQFSRCSN